MRFNYHFVLFCVSKRMNEELLPDCAHTSVEETEYTTQPSPRMLKIFRQKYVYSALCALVLVVVLFFPQPTLGSSSEFRAPNSTKFHDGLRSPKVDAILQEFDSSPNHHIWKPHNVSEREPFIFMHQRKAGGTSLRSTLHMATNSSNMTSFLPCFNDVDCRIFKIPVSPPYAVYGIHTTWSDLQQLVTTHMKRNSVSMALSEPQINNYTAATPVTPGASESFSCLTNFREPVSRLVSCLYFRFQHYFLSRKLSCINDISVVRMTKLLVEKLDYYNNSCLNEPFRVLGPIDDEQTVTSLGYDYNNVTYEVSARIGELELATLNTTLRNLQSCVPIVLEIPQSRRLLKVAFPSLYAMNAFNHGIKIQEGFNYSANCTAPSVAHMHVLVQLASFESVLYRAVVKKVHSSMRSFNIHAPVRNTGHAPHIKHSGIHRNFVGQT